MNRTWDFVGEALDKRAHRNQLRKLKTIVPQSGVEVLLENKQMINFSSNDYLGLSQHTEVKQRSIEYIEKYGVGAPSSRLVCGNYPCHDTVEEKLAQLKGTEKAIVFNSGFQLNVSILTTLADSKSLLLVDKLSHNSLLLGAKLSGAEMIRFQHNNLNHLEKILHTNREKYPLIFIVTESVFSMDGDCSDLVRLKALAKEYTAFLIVDDAHATGVMGTNGMGLTRDHKPDLTIGTFGKGCGSFGAYVSCSAALSDYLINFCPGFIFTTALPPAVIGAIDAALDIIPSMNDARTRLADNAAYLRNSLNTMGFDTGNSASQIVPVIIGSEQDTMAISTQLEKKNILALPIRPPTVSPGKSRIRLALSALHTREHIDYLIDAFREWAKRG